MLFQNGKLKVRKLKRKDAFLLEKWLSDPLVLRYYEGRDNPFDLEKVIREFYEMEEEIVKCIIEFDNKEIGYIQFYQLDAPTKKLYGCSGNSLYGMDQFIGEVEYWNKGIGTLLVSSMAKYLVNHLKAKRVVMDPQTWNLRALKCYEKSGFIKKKKLKKHEYHEGEYQDCWIMVYPS